MKTTSTKTVTRTHIQPYIINDKRWIERIGNSLTDIAKPQSSEDAIDTRQRRNLPDSVRGWIEIGAHIQEEALFQTAFKLSIRYTTV